MKAQNAHQSGRVNNSRFVKYLTIFCTALLLAGLVLVVQLREAANPVPPINTEKRSTGGLDYPYTLVPSDPRLNFPAAEGRQLDMDSDTWFLEGMLEGQETGRRFSFIVVYYVSRIYGFFPFNFYSLTFYDLDNSEYGTYTKYDVGRMKASTGYLDLSLPVDGEDATWTTRIDDNGYLIPFAYHVDLPGIDQSGRAMSLIADASAINPPIAVGADTYNGLITVLKQDNTYSYFQTGIEIEGVLTWGDFSEPVTGNLGHIDRQMFPEFSGVTNSRDGRNLSHEWRTYFLENGMDFSSWWQFDRTDGNSLHSYGGATVYDPENGARYAGDIVYEYLSYVRTEDHPVEPLVPPRANVLYFPSRHRLSSKSLGLELEAEPIVHAPLLAFPVEYMHGPVLLNGTLAGQPIKGIGSFELTLHLYRDFELVTVLSDSVKHLPAQALLPSTASVDEILVNIAQLEEVVNGTSPSSALALARGRIRDQLLSLAKPFRDEMLQILDDLIVALEASSQDQAG